VTFAHMIISQNDLDVKQQTVRTSVTTSYQMMSINQCVMVLMGRSAVVSRNDAMILMALVYGVMVETNIARGL
jgi:hypothetical protein